jgi:hypothetical protein
MHQSTHVGAGATSHGKQRAKKSDAYKRNPECGHSAHAHNEHHRERRRILPMATREQQSVRIGSATRRAGLQGGGRVHVSKLVRLASTGASTGAVVVVDAAAAAAAPSPLAVRAVLLAAAWAAAPVVACASSSLQAGSCLGASALSFQLRWPVAAPADPKPPPPLETVVVSPNASARVRGSAPLARSNPFPLTESAARAWDRHYRSGAGGTVPRRRTGV